MSKKSKIFRTVESSSTRTSLVRDKALLQFYRNNPTKRTGDARSLDNDTYIKTNVGNVTTCCSCAGEITGLQVLWVDNYSFQITWDPLEGADYYSIGVRKGDNTIGPATITYPFENDFTANVVYATDTWSGSENDTFTVTAHKLNCRIQASLEALPCFLAGSLVHMADGTTKAIEDVRVHDLVVGAFGEINEVLFLHRPLLGNARMCCINGEHHTTNHHPHVSADKQFYCGDPATVSAFTYGRTHPVLDEQGQVVEQMLYGLVKERIHTLELGVELKTREGSRVVKSMDVYAMEEDTQLYNLVVGGSHTYHVEGYAVTGWPREDDFDYEKWVPIDA